MIIRRFRSLAGLLLLAGLALGVSLTAIAQAKAAVYVTTAEMQNYFWTWFLAGAGAILGGLAVVYGLLDKSKTSEMRALVQANADQVAAVAKAVEKMAEMFEKHHLDPDAHPAGSRARIEPIRDALAEIREKQEETNMNLTALVAEHHEIRRNEQNICTVLSRRDAVFSREPKRKDDPAGVDWRKPGEKQ